MKNIKPKLIIFSKKGYCTPQIARIAKKINEASSTIHYNISRLEKEGAIKAYKAVFDYKKIDEGSCAFLLISLAPSECPDPERIPRALAKHREVESIDFVTGEWELIIKTRTKDRNDYYNFLRNVISQAGVQKTVSLTSLKQFKTEFVLL